MPADIAIHRTLVVGEPPDEARDRFEEFFGPWMGRGGFKPELHAAGSVGYSQRRFHTWQIVVAVLGFPIGLIALLAERKEYRLDARFREVAPSSTSIVLTGSISAGVSDQLADRIDQFDPAVRAAGT